MSCVKTIRPACVRDVPAICDLVNDYAEQGKMLHRSHESVYDAMREFLVAVDGDDRVVGCVAVDIFWADLAEVKSLAVSREHLGRSVGRQLVAAAIEDARRLGVKRLFALTYEAEFFASQGFETIDRHTLPEKVWKECVACPKVDACDEIAMIMRL